MCKCVSVCACEREIDRGREGVCVCVCEREREGLRGREGYTLEISQLVCSLVVPHTQNLM